MKRKGIKRKFAENFKSIPQSIETRFNSIYLMLKIFVEVYDNLKEFLSSIKNYSQISFL